MTPNPLTRLIEEQKNSAKAIFEANELDGDDVNDCGGAMLSAPDILEFIQDILLPQISEELLISLKGECEKQKHNPDYTCGEATLCERNLACNAIISLINQIIEEK